MRGPAVPFVILAAGGTGGHLFPAEALARELAGRGTRVAIMTDRRSAARAQEAFAGREIFVLHGAGLAGRGARAIGAAAALTLGIAQARTLLARAAPGAIVGFGGYPAVAPILAARLLRRRPALILHEQNAVLGRANRLLSNVADRLALSLDGTGRIPPSLPTTVTGNPVRPAIQALAGTPYHPPGPGPIRLLILGGSLGARALSDLVPPAIAALPEALRHRLSVTQQCRPEDLARVRNAYTTLSIPAALSPFFPDMAPLLADAHLVVARAGASTVAELACAGRPALLIPLPGAIDDHQRANARLLGAEIADQTGLTPTLLAARLTALLDDDALTASAARIATHARPDAASLLANLVQTLTAERALT